MKSSTEKKAITEWSHVRKKSAQEMGKAMELRFNSTEFYFLPFACLFPNFLQHISAASRVIGY